MSKFFSSFSVKLCLIFICITITAVVCWGVYHYQRSMTQWQSVQKSKIDQRTSMFVDHVGNNFALKGGSPAIDAGINSPDMENTLDLYESTFGVNIRKDIIGNNRPIDGDGSSTAEWDLGAYEYTG